MRALTRPSVAFALVAPLLVVALLSSARKTGSQHTTAPSNAPRASEAQDASMLQGSMRDKIDISKLGPQVGERVPDFRLKDQVGKTRTLDSVMGPKGAMLVFFRSADW